MKKIYVLDTNVFLTNSKSIFEFGNNDIVIPLKVLDEIDKQYLSEVMILKMFRWVVILRAQIIKLLQQL